MRKVQDDFFINVGNPFGLLRYGPKRLRMTREEIKNRDHEKRLKQKNAVDLFEQEEKAKKQAAEIEKAENNLEKLLSKKQGIEDNLQSREKALSDSEEAIKKREIAVAFSEGRQADFESSLKTGLKGWQLPSPNVGEFAGHYIKRVAGEVMGKVQRAMNLIKEYKQKKEELEKEKAAFEEGKKESQRQETVRIAQSERIHLERVRRLRDTYEKLKNKILKVKTSQELTNLKKELSSEKQHTW
jgi:DNA repair exonuclease SbcCD ATPase subunit